MGFLKKKKEKIKKVEPTLPEDVELEEGEEYTEEQPKKEEVKEEDNNAWSVQEMTTQTQPVIYNKETKKTYDLFSAVVELLNRTE